MFKRNLHLMGLMVCLYSVLITYTALGRLEIALGLLFFLIALKKAGCLLQGQMVVVILLFIGVYLTAWNFESLSQERWQAVYNLSSVPLKITGVVENENPFKTDRTTIKVERMVAVDGLAVSDKALRWMQGRKIRVQIGGAFSKGNDSRIPVLSKAFYKKGGRRVVLVLKPQLAARAGNPGFFDYRLYLALSNVWMTGYVDESSLLWGPVAAPVLSIREALILNIKKRLDRVNMPESLGPSLGMLLGFDDYMTDSSVADYYVAGTVHVLTVSGFHFALVYAVLNGLMGRLPLPYAIRMLLSVAFVLFFLLLTGIKFAPYRAGVSMLVMMASGCLERRFDLATAASVIVMPELLMNPYKAADMSLTLSYLACLAISHGAWFLKKGLCFECWKPLWQKCCSSFVFLMAVQAALWLPIVRSNNLINFMAVPSNLLGTLISGYMLLLNTLLVVLNLHSTWWCRCFSYINGVGFLLMDLVNRLYKLCPGSIVYLSDPGGLMFALYGVYLTVIVLSANVDLRKMKVQQKITVFAVVLTVAMVLSAICPVDGERASDMKLFFIDAGQGDALLIQTPKGRWLAVDCGPDKLDFQQVALNLGARHLDRIYLTHGHLDHAGGLISLKGKLTVGSYAFGVGTVLDPGIKMDPKQCRFIRGDSVENWDGVIVRSLLMGSAETALTTAKGPSDPNETGILYWVSYGGTDVLVTGDAGQLQQDAAIRRMGKQGRTLEMIKVAHHGSPKSTETAWAESLRCKLAVVSVGKNRYGHPSPALLESFVRCGAKVYRTDERGCVAMYCDGRRVRVKTFKMGPWSLKSCSP